LNLAEAMIHCNETLAYHDATPSALADGPWSPAAVRERGQAIDVAWEHEPKQPKLPCFAVGNYEGGELCINNGDNVKCFDINGKILKYNGRVPHSLSVSDILNSGGEKRERYRALLCCLQAN
jgi:hypothetical protein